MVEVKAYKRTANCCLMITLALTPGADDSSFMYLSCARQGNGYLVYFVVETYEIANYGSQLPARAFSVPCLTQCCISTEVRCQGTKARSGS